MRIDFLYVLAVAFLATVFFLAWKDRLHRPMWIIRSVVIALLLLVLGGTAVEAVGLGMIAGLLWEILNELASRKPGDSSPETRRAPMAGAPV